LLDRLQKLNYHDYDKLASSSKGRHFEWVSKKLPNGDEYTGQTKDDLFDGRGTLKTKDGNKYVGQFHKGMKHGVGPSTHMHRDIYRDISILHM